MSVLRHGSSYLQRRLTKMYTDTKTSCESVTTAARANDDPELIALHRNFRTQKDRLLAWGLDWSDSSAAQPNDIDESLTEAGFSDVVASVMSSIQEILNEAERLQHIDSELPLKGSSKASSSDFPTKLDVSQLPIKTQWTEEDIKRSNALLGDLTSCIDTLYDLSRSRRDMSMNLSSNEPAAAKTRSWVHTTPSSSSDTPYRSMSVDYLSPITHEPYKSPSEGSPIVTSPKSERHESFPFTSLHASPTVFEKHAEAERAFTEPFSASKQSKHLFLDRSALQLTGPSHAQTPPPYEQVAASTNSRALGRINTSAAPFLTGLTKESTLPVLVEFTPMLLESQNSITVPGNSRLEKLQRVLDQLVENSRVSHLALLRFLGYYIDMPNARYAFVYQMPMDYFPFPFQPSNIFMKELKPRTLVSFYQSGDDSQDLPVPSLEARFRLAYDLLQAVLHLRSQNVVHGNINSSNIVVFPSVNNSSQERNGNLKEDLRHIYLTSCAQFSGNEPCPEPLSASMYRHPDDKRQLDDAAAWAYDLYSLGLVLLEIGLWTPISRLWKMKYNNAMFKQRIENVYIHKLASKCSSTYLHVVQLCLDAPNFFFSTQPMTDLGLRVPEIYHYPALELAEPESIFSFSANLLYTVTKFIWRCCSLDIFSSPPVEDLGDALPIALVQDLAIASSEVHSTVTRIPGKPAIREVDSFEKLAHAHMGLAGERIDLSDKKPVKKRTLKKLTNVEIPQDHLNEWNFTMLPRLSKLLQKILKDSPESCSATLMMTGESPETTKTTICVTCSSVKKVRCALKKHFELERDGWDMIVIRGDVKRSKVPSRKRLRPQSARLVNTDELSFPRDHPNPFHQQKPLCGASIGAFRNEEHLPPVSYGGAILIDGVPYGMTVHHMLEVPSEDEEDEEDEGDEDEFPPRSSTANWRGNMDVPATAPFSTDLGWDHSGIHGHEADYEFQITDDEDAESETQDVDNDWFSDDESSDDEGYDPQEGHDNEDAVSIGDTSGIEPGDEPRLFVTQPAIDDVPDGYFPTLEDRDDDHLASHTLGYIHASSGLRRWTKKGIKHEIDWALIKIEDHRVNPCNIIHRRRGWGYSHSVTQQYHELNTIQLARVSSLDELGGRKVHCCGRTSGLQSGHISPALMLVKLYGRESFSTSFGVHGNFGVPGDSGAWVFDHTTGQVCGHVLAWSNKLRTAYIAPMQIILEDIARTLGASTIALPAFPPIRSNTVPTSTGIISSSGRQQHFELGMPRITDQFAIDMSRLNLNNTFHPDTNRAERSRLPPDDATDTSNIRNRQNSSSATPPSDYRSRHPMRSTSSPSSSSNPTSFVVPRRPLMRTRAEVGLERGVA